jgi:hypothetical protein
VSTAVSSVGMTPNPFCRRIPPLRLLLANLALVPAVLLGATSTPSRAVGESHVQAPSVSRCPRLPPLVASESGAEFELTPDIVAAAIQCAALVLPEAQFGSYTLRRSFVRRREPGSRVILRIRVELYFVRSGASERCATVLLSVRSEGVWSLGSLSSKRASQGERAVCSR